MPADCHDEDAAEEGGQGSGKSIFVSTLEGRGKKQLH